MSDTSPVRFGRVRWLLVAIAVVLLVGWVVLSIAQGEVTTAAWLGIVAMILLVVGQVQGWCSQIKRDQRGER